MASLSTTVSETVIAIPEGQQKLVSELAKTGKPVIALVMCGRPVIFHEIREQADAVLGTWWLGSEAGNAICLSLIHIYGTNITAFRLFVEIYQGQDRVL